MTIRLLPLLALVGKTVAKAIKIRPDQPGGIALLAGAVMIPVLAG
jgi:hypothetical protein